jgi:hypothetical protein
MDGGYTGQWEFGHAHGYGIDRFKFNYEPYNGQFKDGNRDGHGYSTDR